MKKYRALNGDLHSSIDDYLHELTHKNVSEIKKHTMLKRMIRGAYLKINVKDESWSTKLQENVTILQSYFPDEKVFHRIKT